LCLSFAAWTGKQENNVSASELEEKEGYATQDLQGASVLIVFSFFQATLSLFVTASVQAQEKSGAKGERSQP